MKSLVIKMAVLAVLATSLSGCIVIVKDDKSKPVHNHKTTQNQA